MRACVTGGTYFVGRALVRRLLRDGVSVRVLVEPSEHPDKIGVEFASVNLTDKESIAGALEDVDVLYHTAETKLDETQNIFEACIKKSVPHVVCLSSTAVYGLADKGETIDEITPWDIHLEERDGETRATFEREQYARAIGNKTKLAVTIVRAGIVYGPTKPLPEGPLGYRAALGRSLVFGRREQHFPLTYVDNLADAMALLRTGRGLRTFIVIDDGELTLGQYHAVRQEVEGTPTTFLPGWPLLFAAVAFEILMWLHPTGFGAGNKWRRIRLHLQDRRFDAHRIREETGWAPKVSLKDAIQLTLRRTSAKDSCGPDRNS